MDLNKLSLNRIKKLSSTWGVKGRSKMNKKQLQNALEKMLMTVLQNDDFDLYEEMLRDFAKKEVKKTSRKPKKTSRKPVKKTSRKPVKKTSRKPVKKTSRKPVKKTSRKPVKKTSRKPKKTSRKPKKTSRKPVKKTSRKPVKKTSRKPVKKTSRKPVKKTRSNLVFLDKKLIDIKNDIKKIDTDIKKAQQLQTEAQTLLNKIIKIQNPSERITQDIAYNEGLIIDLEKDIGKLTQKKYELDERDAFLKMLYTELNRDELSTQFIHQLKYSISKLNDKELQKNLMTVLQTKK